MSDQGRLSPDFADPATIGSATPVGAGIALVLGRGFHGFGENAGEVIVEEHPDKVVRNIRAITAREVTPLVGRYTTPIVRPPNKLNLNGPGEGSAFD